MRTLSIRLPKSLYEQVRELAESEGISMNQFIALAVAEKISALMSIEYLEERARRGIREKFDAVLVKVPEVQKTIRGE
jgi:predicted DNA-binding protein